MAVQVIDLVDREQVEDRVDKPTVAFQSGHHFGNVVVVKNCGLQRVWRWKEGY